MDDLLKYCRYYKGEEECPEENTKNNNSYLWYYEKMWVENPAFRDESFDPDNINFYEYKNAGLIDFNLNDNVPVTLKALLFNRYGHWSGGYENIPEGFKKWYNEFYLKNNINLFSV